MPVPPSQAGRDRDSYIPPQIEQAMNHQLQASMPAHLRRYAESGGYVPQRAQAEMTSFMEKSLPAHLKQYSGAYMQQKIINPVRQPAVMSGPGHTMPPPVPDPLRLSHSMPSVGQVTVDPNNLSVAGSLFRPEEPSEDLTRQIPADPTRNPYQEHLVRPQESLLPPAQPVQPQPGQPVTPQPQTATTAQPAASGPDYSFILNPEKPHKPGFSLGGGQSIAMRFVIFGGGLVVLLILFTIIKGLLGGGPDFSSVVQVDEDQQELIHIVTAATQQQGISSDNQNFAYTALLAIGSSQSQLTTYLSKNNVKITAPILNLKVSTQTDQQLTAAASAGTYDETFQQVMQAQMKTYGSDLKLAYTQDKGVNGRKLLTSDYNQLQLMITQLNSPTS